MALMDGPPDMPHYLCSHLVRLRISDADATEQWANLEEIWGSGAVLECEEDVNPGTTAKISADNVSFSGRVTATERHEFGWRIEITFSPLTPWTIERWSPEHALNLATLKGKH